MACECRAETSTSPNLSVTAVALFLSWYPNNRNCRYRIHCLVYCSTEVVFIHQHLTGLVTTLQLRSHSLITISQTLFLQRHNPIYQPSMFLCGKSLELGCTSLGGSLNLVCASTWASTSGGALNGTWGWLALIASSTFGVCFVGFL